MKYYITYYSNITRICYYTISGGWTNDTDKSKINFFNDIDSAKKVIVKNIIDDIQWDIWGANEYYSIIADNDFLVKKFGYKTYNSVIIRLLFQHQNLSENNINVLRKKLMESI